MDGCIIIIITVLMLLCLIISTQLCKLGVKERVALKCLKIQLHSNAVFTY